MLDEGFIKLHRKILKWEWYGDTPARSIFIHLLILANHKSKRWQGQTIERGQVVTGRKKLARALGITEQQVRSALTRLKSTNEITTEATNKFTIVTICNYSRYHEVRKENNQQNTEDLTINQPTTNQQVTTTKNVKNVKNVKKLKTIRGNLTFLQELWNKQIDCVRSDLSKVDRSSKIREQKEKLRLKEFSTTEWNNIFKKINQSSFCVGINDRAWKASFDWIITNDNNAVKVLEGKYDDKKGFIGGKRQAVKKAETKSGKQRYSRPDSFHT